MEITLSTRQWAIIKRTAQNVAPNVAKKANIQKKMLELASEYKSLDAQIAGFEQGIKALCHGLGTEDLIHRAVTIVEGKFDKDGRPLKKVSYEPNSNVVYDAAKNVYVVTVPEVEVTGSDFDVDNASTEEPVDEETQETHAETLPEPPAEIQIEDSIF